MSCFVLAAGGTGGHMMPAHALAGELGRREHKVVLVTDERGRRIPGLFAGVDVHVMPAGRIAGGPLGWLKAWAGIRAGRAMAGRLYGELRPAAVIGFGGYPALPALLAALDRKIACAVHEQNAVLGRVNRLLAKRVSAIATAYAHVARLKPRDAAKIALVGNPVRQEVKAIGRAAFPPIWGTSPLRILVTGGSQGATILSTVVPEGLGLLPEPMRARLRVVQQCRPEDIDAVRAAYARLGIEAELAAYLEDLPSVLANAHLVIARAGASTIAELTVAGRPAILVPLPSAMDDHQTANARAMAETGGAVSIAQGEFTPERLAEAVVGLVGRLARAGAEAKMAGFPDATERLADLVEGIAKSSPSFARGGGPSPQAMVEGQSPTVAHNPSTTRFAGGPPPRASSGRIS